MDPDCFDFDAIILAGGRSSRLGGVPKQGLTYDGDTLLRRSAAAVGGARAAVVVGPGDEIDGGVPQGFLTCREEPPFSGPAAAVAAGLATLAATGGTPPRFTLLLACDMPNVMQAVTALRSALAQGGPGETRPDGAIAVSPEGRHQLLVGFYSTAALQRAASDLACSGRLINGSMRALLASLDVQLVAVPAGSTDDVDTWDDAAALGVVGPDFRNRLQETVATTDELGGRA